jgi:hypothetical protein
VTRHLVDAHPWSSTQGQAVICGQESVGLFGICGAVSTWTWELRGERNFVPLGIYDSILIQQMTPCAHLQRPRSPVGLEVLGAGDVCESYYALTGQEEQMRMGKHGRPAGLTNTATVPGGVKYVLLDQVLMRRTSS